MISKTQVREAEKGIPVAVRIDNTDYVLIRKDVYEKVQSIYDASEWSHEELLQTFARAAQSSDWNDPSMDVYDDYDCAKK